MITCYVSIAMTLHHMNIAKVSVALLVASLYLLCTKIYSSIWKANSLKYLSGIRDVYSVSYAIISQCHTHNLPKSDSDEALLNRLSKVKTIALYMQPRQFSNTLKCLAVLLGAERTML
jgi:hypothetical protein